MPIYCYEPRDPKKSCAACANGFECSQRMGDPALDKCPECGAPVRRVPAPIAVGRSESSLDDRAKAAGFTKLKRLGKGEYERQY